MAWNNNRRNGGYNNGGGYNNSYGNNGGGYGNNNGGSYNSRNQQRSKKSGVTYSKIKQGQFEGLMIVNAWLKMKDLLLTLKIAPYNKTVKGSSADVVKSQSGKTYLKYICEAVYSNGNHRLIPVMYSVETRKIAIPELNLLVTPNGAGVTSSGKKVTGSVVRLNG